MGKGTRRLTGFLWAMIIAIVSFFVIFIFFPDVSHKFFGTAIRDSKKIGQAVETGLETAAEAISDAAESVVKDAPGVISELAQGASDAVAGVVK